MSNQSNIDKSVSMLIQASETGNTIGPIRDLIGETDLDSAYAIQERVVKHRLKHGDIIVGKKIGLTSFAVQKQLGVDQPDYGVLFNTMEVKNNAIEFKELMQPKAEAEIAFVMKETLDGEVNISDLIEAIDYAVCSIEIVGSRVADWNIRITDTIADNASASHYILGEKKVPLDELDLENCKMTVTKNGELASEGTGAACMDNPLNAALWLAQTMAAKKSPIRKGEVLLSGALGPMVAFEQGDVLVASIDGLGSVELRVK